VEGKGKMPDFFLSIFDKVHQVKKLFSSLKDPLLLKIRFTSVQKDADHRAFCLLILISETIMTL
jgi:hypothetical protein